MYTPKHFKAEDPELVQQVVRENPFAILITPILSEPLRPASHRMRGSLAISHLLAVWQPDRGEHGTVVSHMAKANDHWQAFDSEAESVFIFGGPHAYVSSSWYTQNRAVPTWNYAAVHLHGRPQTVDGARAQEVLRDIVSTFETGNETYPFSELDEAIERLHAGVVAFEMPVTRIEAKFKMSQNKRPQDRDRVIENLGESGRESDREVAEFMRTLYRL